ncbi:MAG: hypothetical protein ACRD4Q_00175 [Candidatus Acidiferrales bacterium]
MPTGFPDYYGGLTLPVTVPEGGTGYTSVDAHALLVGNDSGKLNLIDPDTLGKVLTAQGTDADPIWATPSVDASDITGILAIAHGGTGSASPALVAGDGISLSGTWPNQTITNSDDAYFSGGILAIAHGGTGSSSPALTAGSNIDITGSWPANTIAVASAPTFSGLVTSENGFEAETDSFPAVYFNNGSGVGQWQISHNSGDGTHAALLVFDNVNSRTVCAFNTDGSITLHTPLPIASGGTGTGSPALVAGTGISISGSWPNQTIANSSPTPAYSARFVKVAATATSGSYTFPTSFGTTPVGAATPTSQLASGVRFFASITTTAITITMSSAATIDTFFTFYVTEEAN